MLHKTKPDNFAKQFDVVACFVECDGKFLMLRRHSEKPNGGRWGLPAGKVDTNESLEEAIGRELREETGIICDQSAFELCDSALVTHEGTDFEYHMYRLQLNELPEVIVNNIEHVDADWFLPTESLLLHQVYDQADCTKLVYRL